MRLKRAISVPEASEVADGVTCERRLRHLHHQRHSQAHERWNWIIRIRRWYAQTQKRSPRINCTCHAFVSGVYRGREQV